MSDKLPQSQNPEEVDIGQIFVYIEKLFVKLKDLLLSLFGILVFLLKKIGVFLLLCANILKKHFIPIGFAVIVGYGLLTLLDKTTPPIYQSSIILNQNYRTGRVLYNTINRYGLLARDRDSVGLGKLLNTPSSTAAKIVGFDVFDDMNRINLRDQYYRYIKDVDSTLIISFNSYSEEYDLENVRTQTINIYSTDPTIFNNLTEGFVKGIESNPFFIQEKEKELTRINGKIKVYEKMLSKSDTLQYEYLDLLKNYYIKSGENPRGRESTLNLNLASTKEKIDTKEYQLFEEQKKINLLIIELQEELENKKEIFSIQSEFNPPVIVTSSYQKNRTKAALFLGGIAFLFFLLKHLGASDFLSKYGNKEELLKQ